MNEVIRFSATQKPCGDEYKKIAYWNRFVRVKWETLILIALVGIAIGGGIFRLKTGTMDSFSAILYIIFLLYPFLVMSQYNATIKYHLRHRDPSEIAPCEFCIMSNGILIDVEEYDVHSFVHYNELTHVYTNVFGYYMMFQNKKVLAMIRHRDIPDGREKEFEDMMIKGLSEKCKVSKWI